MNTDIIISIIKKVRQEILLKLIHHESDIHTLLDEINENLRNMENLLERYVEHLSLKDRNLLNTEEAYQYLGISRRYLFKLISKKEIPYYKLNSRRNIFKREDLDEWINKLKKEN
ncbi:MAG: helix-turn-helix domain-containing protein [Marinifilaceae bacterium]|jgi:excisionase family DNA binding protein|nr:DNA-binding protein [Marinilabiliaceae bacterium JC040]MCT4599392.1 helix-turn-helix domain-containing protein [Marinifilaceae bacterium]